MNNKFLTIVSGAIALATSNISNAAVDVDIRVSGTLSSNANEISYIANVGNCSSLTSIDIRAGDLQETLATADATRSTTSPLACQFNFTATGSNVFTPTINLHFQDNTTQQHSETFEIEYNKPSIVFDSVGIQSQGEDQVLAVKVRANDEVDIQYVNFSVIGLRASDLRAAGGVVSQAKKSAFALTESAHRVYPHFDGQQEFTLSVPINSALSADAIRHDGIVLIDASVVDSTGNQNAFSKGNYSPRRADFFYSQSHLNCDQWINAFVRHRLQVT